MLRLNNVTDNTPEAVIQNYHSAIYQNKIYRIVDWQGTQILLCDSSPQSKKRITKYAEMNDITLFLKQEIA